MINAVVQTRSLWREIFAIGREKNWLRPETAPRRADPLERDVWR